MLYLSTRNRTIKSLPSQAILDGIAADGGLNIPESFDLLRFEPQELEHMSNLDISVNVLARFFTDFTKDEIREVVQSAYADKFPQGDIAPLKAVGNAFVMELYHGPTCAFKDVALLALPQLMAKARKKNDLKEKILILTATSGDTGSAALNGFADVEGVEIIVFYPRVGISDVQEKQMTSCAGKNVHVCAIEGNFDDAQRGVKKIFAELTDEIPGVVLSSANSINIGRLAPQIAYYFKAYKELMSTGAIKCGEMVNFAVPTGNFGNILAGYFAKKMGLPIAKLICASNENDVLTEFLETGIYKSKRQFHVTNSPSMDILVSSNLERLISMTCGFEKTKEYMQQLTQDGEYAVSAENVQTIRRDFACGRSGEQETLDTIREVYTKYAYLMDTHTAVAWKVYEDWQKEQDNGCPTVILSTASPYKFCASVLKALTKEEVSGDGFALMEKLWELTGVPVPERLAALKDAKSLHNDTINKEMMKEYVIEKGNEAKWRK